MQNISDFLNFNMVSFEESVLRCLLAMIFGLIIGWDRDAKNKPMDFRAYMIVAVSTCIIAIMGQELYADYDTADNVMRVDLSKIIAGVLTGIGFLGAGAIIKRDNQQVVGTATGASIWGSGGIGLALGFGFYGLSFIAFSAFVLILVIGGWLVPKLQDGNDKLEKQKELE